MQASVQPQRVDTTARLAELRKLMNDPEHAVQAIVVPTEDQHFSEYVAPCDRRREFITGFTGSAGCALITLKDALLFTDGRYHLQAEQQLDKNWTLMKVGLSDVPTWKDYLSKNIEEGAQIGIDPNLIRAADANSLKTSLHSRKAQLVSLKTNLVDVVWGASRPPRPKNQVFPLDIKYSGESCEDKIRRLRTELTKAKAKGVIVSVLDEIAWLFNLRGLDIEYNPVFFSYAVVTHDAVKLFLAEEQANDVVRHHLGKHVEVLPYDSFPVYVKSLPEQLGLSKDARLILGETVSLAIAEAIGSDNYNIQTSPVENLKAVKNSTEIEGFRQCHVRDGAALVRYLAWLEEQLHNGVQFTEAGAADVLKKFRSELDLFQGLSFETISATGPNAAIVHYKPEPGDIIKQDQMYLCDSGGQYLDGTTDVTRTLHFGNPTVEEKRLFTMVLQGHIAVATAIFPKETIGVALDSWARRALWKEGLNYLHGTGHGVGHFLNVHEGPQSLSSRTGKGNARLKAGMTITNEPGIYLEGKFGIRIESVMIVRPAKMPYSETGYLTFETVTVCPIQTKLVDLDLLTAEEKGWLNSYHAEVFQKVSPLLQNDERALKWLERGCSAI